MVNQKEFRIQGIDNDSSLELMDDGSYLNLMNARIGVSETGKSLRIENIKGTTALTNAKYPPYGTNQTIGSCIDIEGRRLIWFVYNTFSDNGIYAYSFDDKTIYAVLYDSQIAGGLGFSKDSRIDRNCRVVNGLLYWTDNLNEPKKINIDSGIKLNQPSYVTTQRAYQTLTDSYEVTLIRRPPIYPPTITKLYDSTFVNNFIGLLSFEFAWQYIYFDGEASVLGEFSTSSQLNVVVAGIMGTQNYIKADLSFNEKIPQTARIIRLVAKNQLTLGYNVVKTWDKEVDETPFTLHNNGTTQLSYNYYGDVLGESIDSATSVKPYDSVPLLSKTLETAVSRIFLGNNLEGYDTPTYPTSMTVSDSEAAFSAIQTDAAYDSGNPMDEGRDSLIYTFQGGTSSLVSIGILVTYTTISSSHGQAFNYTYNGTDTISDIIDWFYTAINASTYFRCLKTSDSNNTVPADSIMVYSIYDASSIVGVLTIDPTIAGSGDKYFKNESAYQIGIVYYDKARRKCGVSTNNNLIAKTPIKNFANSNIVSINWALSNTNAELQIPDWAYYYSIVRTKNLKTRYFIDSLSSMAHYATKNADGTYAYTATTFSATTAAVVVDTTILVQSGLGYTYNEGDVCVLVKPDDTRFELPVIGTDGIYVLLNPVDLGTLTGTNWAFEIYTPYIRTENEPYYEVGNMYAITNPTLSSRTFSTLSGTLNGDIYRLSRLNGSTTYYVEAMSPNDKYYQNWVVDDGFINYVTLLGQVRNKHEIRYSNVFTAGTQNNGLSTFEALNFKTVPLGTGEINKLQLASKTSEQGVIMLSIDSFQTVSCYLGEVQVIGASQNAFLAQDSSVIGTMNVLKGMFGTTAPETVIEYLGNVFWFDLVNTAIVQYSANGLYPISNYKMASFFWKYASNYNDTSNATLDTLNGFHHIPTSINPFTKQFQITTPALIDTSAATVLPSYDGVAPSYASSIVNRFDIYTGLGQTLCYDIESNRWMSAMEYVGEWYDFYQGEVFGFKNGVIYTHDTNSSTWNTFYGVQCPVRFCFTANPPLSGVKDVTGLTVEGNKIPNYSVLYSDYPNVQITDMTSSDYRNQEGVMYSNWYRDRLSPNVSGTAIQKMYSGDIIKSKTPMLMVEFHQYTELCYVSMTDVNFAISRGQKQILQNG